MLNLAELISNYTRSDRQVAMDRYEGWKKIRERAVQNAKGHLPEGFAEDEPQPPPPPSPDDGDVVDLAMDLNAVSIDGEVPHELDESGIERVPTADPGLDVSEEVLLLLRANGLV
jgi:serine/threonine-protein phosphatase 2A regulatory subunit B'